MVELAFQAQMSQTPLAKYRQSFEPQLDAIFYQLKKVKVKRGNQRALSYEIESTFPHLSSQACDLEFEAFQEPLPSFEALKVGVLLSGGPAPGGHNVITGIFDALMSLNQAGQLIGFYEGMKGFLEARFLKLTSAVLEPFRHSGGFDLLGSSRTKIETKEHFELARKVVQELQLEALVIIGGDDSNTNAALLAEDFLSNQIPCCVVGVPKTIDGDMKGGGIELSFGFDTATKVYSQLISDLAHDAVSSRKYYHFIRLMGRSASHITLECALQTQCTWAFIGEQVRQEKYSLENLVDQLEEVVLIRLKHGLQHGVILIPEGLVEFVEEFSDLIQELSLITLNRSNLTVEEAQESLQKSAKLFKALPGEVKKQLLLEKDPHGNVQVSKIEMEKVLIDLLTRRFKDKNISIDCLSHFLGYEARCAMPTDFDATYAYALGRVAATLIKEGLSGFMACVKDLHRPSHEWKLAAQPLVSLIHLESRKGKLKPVIKKALVDTTSSSFLYFEKHRNLWKEQDCFRFVGPIQYAGPSSIRGKGPLSLHLNAAHQYFTSIEEFI